MASTPLCQRPRAIGLTRPAPGSQQTDAQIAAPHQATALSPALAVPAEAGELVQAEQSEQPPAPYRPTRFQTW